ncbi:hypothetical protein AMJ57_01610 [Parcubacteria bacterium SG8_24]|nr:MAG: hypothetical protein AMJ57_01610 [Parcubacteria bacterium SG8_24]
MPDKRDRGGRNGSEEKRTGPDVEKGEDRPRPEAAPGETEILDLNDLIRQAEEQAGQMTSDRDKFVSESQERLEQAIESVGLERSAVIPIIEECLPELEELEGEFDKLIDETVEAQGALLGAETKSRLETLIESEKKGRPHLRLVETIGGPQTLDERRQAKATEEDRAGERFATTMIWHDKMAVQHPKSWRHIEETIEDAIAGELEDSFRPKGLLKRVVYRVREVLPSRKPKEVRSLERLRQGSLDSLRNLEQEHLSFFRDQFDHLKKILPELNVGFFEEALTEIGTEIEEIVNDRPAEDSKGLRVEIHDIQSLRDRLVTLKEVFYLAVDREAGRKFAPLMELAYSDVRRHLMGLANRPGVDPEDAQAFLEFELSREMPTRFGPSLRKDKEILGVAEFSRRQIRINTDMIRVMENGEVDELALMETMVHEIIHSVSAIGWKGDLGLEACPDLFEDAPSRDKERSSEAYFNELATETLALQIVSKYYDEEKPPGTTVLHGEAEQQLVGYADMVRAFRDLEEKHGDKVGELERLASEVVIFGQGTYDQKWTESMKEMRALLEAEPELHADLKEVCSLKFRERQES